METEFDPKKSTVSYSQEKANIVKEAENSLRRPIPALEEVDAPDEPQSEYEKSSYEIKEKMKKEKKLKKKKKLSEAEIRFSEQIKIDFIKAIDFRILCRFLGVGSVNDVKNHPLEASALINLILMENLYSFMEQKGFAFAGELNFDRNGNSMPLEKTAWKIKNKEVVFATKGFVFFEKKGGKSTDNIAYFLFTDRDTGMAYITCYSTNKDISKQYINDLQQITKNNNCLRGAKLKDINMLSATFSEIEKKEKFTWKNYYYPQDIKDIFSLEVSGFVENVKKYNERGIDKRGLIIHGKPGTGKTTLGNIICNLLPDTTVIWITPEILSENHRRTTTSIKTLYKLADFLSPCVIILEDLDLFSQHRESGSDILSLGALMNVLDGVNSISNSVTIGTTNRLSLIEGALRNRPGRFDRVIEIPPLTKKLRIAMLKERLSKWKVSKGTFDYIVNSTNDWTGAEVQEFINSLNLKAINENKDKQKLNKTLAKDVLDTMAKFGVGEKSSDFGFTKK